MLAVVDEARAVAGRGVPFATKPELARKMIGRAREAGVPFSWVAGDKVYGGNPKLRAWLEEQQISYVMATACNDVVPMAAGGMRADEAADLVRLTAAEARRLFNLHTRVTRPAEFHRQWSRWRRRRQASARKSHYARRLRDHETLL